MIAIAAFALSLASAVPAAALPPPLPAPADAFAPGPRASAARLSLQGRLSLAAVARPDGFKLLRDDDPAGRGADPRRTWPALAIDLVQDGERLIPARRGPIANRHAAWEWMVEPGRLWREPADGEGARAALPVALEERNANCLHNGHLLVLFGPDAAVRSAAVQFAAETCLYFKFDAWSRVSGRFTPAAVAGAEALTARDRTSRAARLPLRPLSELKASHPGLDLAALAQAAGDPAAVYGLVVDGVNYAAPCPTRYGEDPACEERDLPSYSTAKALVAGLGLMRFERLARGTAAETVAAHVPACARAGGWGDVKLIDLLDMASGHYRSAAFEADEDAPETQAFFKAETHPDKLAFACARYPRAAAPGRTWVYHTTDTYLLGVALTDVLRRAKGPRADLYDEVLRPLWRRLALNPTLDVTRRTYDPAAQPFVGWGLALQRDDIARLALFLQNDARLDGEPFADPTLLGEALQRRGPGFGFQAGGASYRYAHGFWARDVGPLVGCGAPVWVPFLSGYGGVSVVLLPNGAVFYTVGDENRFDWGLAAVEAHKLKGLCA